ncbi:hypothetical protein DSO57_1038963 [Entomophthora muscae]|uniref:Uncharacterized protein n=1 Tax=Entomophthora muscae TaxID=34485 RepID=A0ACC2U828_9FUNG|nr:hypothetical protein DSO57_1038963 [Entomophthora muscae]
MEQPKELRKQRSISKIKKKRFNLLKWFRGSRRKSAQQNDMPNPPPEEPRMSRLSLMELPMQPEIEARSSGSSEQGPLTPEISPKEFTRKGISFEESRDSSQKRTSTLFSIARRPFSSHATEKRTPYPISMSMDCERYLTKDAALRQLRDIRSFDDMIVNGFNAPHPEEPRSYTIAFSLTPPPSLRI